MATSIYLSDEKIDNMFRHWSEIHWKSFSQAGLAGRYWHEFNSTLRRAYICQLEQKHPRIWQRIYSESV